MTELGIKLPLRIVPLEEAVKVVDAGERTISYTCVCDASEREIQTRQFSRDEAVAIAKVIARSLTAHVEGSSVPGAD